MIRILLVGDDAETARALDVALNATVFSLDCVQTGGEALRLRPDVDVILLTLELPDLDGTEVCRRIRATSDVPVIGLVKSASTELERILALRAGADMCLTKPVGIDELVARLTVVTRRRQPHPAVTESLSYGALEIDGAAREVRVEGAPVDLTRKEFDLLYLLASRRGAIVNRKQILSAVWNDDNAWMQRSRTIDTHVNSIRRKIGPSGDIRTQRGVGFRFCHS